MTGERSRVDSEMRGEVCVIRCGGVAGDRLAADLPGEVGRCLGSGATAAVVDLDPWAPMDAAGLAALRAAADVFAEAGGELVVAVEEPDARQALAAAGLMGAVPAAPGPPGGDAGVPLRQPDRPRWEHDFVFPASTRQLRTARRRVAAFAEVAGLADGAVFELSVAVTEALANAVVHGSPRGADDDVCVRFFWASTSCAPSPTRSTTRAARWARACCWSSDAPEGRADGVPRQNPVAG